MAEDLVRIEIEKVLPETGVASQTIIKDGKLTKQVPTSGVRITITGNDGSVITDIWTRDQFLGFCQYAKQIISDG